MRSRLLVLVIACSAALLAGCAASPPVETTSTATSTPSVQEPTGSAPLGFSTVDGQAVTLPTDGGWPGLLDGLNAYPVDGHATLWGISLPGGQAIFNTSLTSQDGGAASDWGCPVQAVDAQNIYTAVSNLADPHAPAFLEVSAVDKLSGDVLWRYLATIDVMPGADSGCGSPLAYDLTATAAGLLVSLTQTDQMSDAVTQTSSMLDATTGDELWNITGLVSAATQARVGIVVLSDFTNSSVQLNLIDLDAGQVGPSVATAKARDGFEMTRFYLAGQSGQMLFIVQVESQISREPAPGGSTDQLSVIQVGANADRLTNQRSWQVEQAGLGNCQLGSDQVLVCQSNANANLAFGISLTSGATIWQRQYAPDYDGAAPQIGPPLLFSGHLYGVDSSGATSFVSDVNSGQVVAVGTWPQLLVVNQFGAIASVSQGQGGPYQWIPAQH